MVTLYVYGRIKKAEDVVPPNMEIVKDVEVEFGINGFKMSQAAKDIVKYVDEGELQNTQYFKDRFGISLYTDCLSTGSKAGLLVSSSDKVIDLTECGLNAIAAIILYCKSGYAVLQNPQYDFEGDWSTPVDVMIDDEHLTTLGDVCMYLNEGKLFKEIDMLVAKGELQDGDPTWPR